MCQTTSGQASPLNRTPSSPGNATPVVSGIDTQNHAATPRQNLSTSAAQISRRSAKRKLAHTATPDLERNGDRDDLTQLFAQCPSSPPVIQQLGEYEQRKARLAKLAESMLARLPQFLFRVTSDQSQGLNSPGLYQARSILQLGPSIFFIYNREEICKTLDEHVQNKSTPGPWISFTASPKRAIDFALMWESRGHKNISIHMADTFRLKRAALILHCQTMLQVYGVKLNRAHYLNVAAKKTSEEEYLVWNELQISAGVVSLQDLLSPRPVRPNTRAPGLQTIMRNLTKKPKNGEYIIKRAPKYARYCNYKDKKEDYELTKKSILGQSALPREHLRLIQDDWVLQDYGVLVKNMAQDFQKPMVSALLSTQTDFVDEASLLEEVDKLPKDWLLASESSEVRSFWVTTTRSDATTDVQKFEEFHSQICAKTFGPGAVKAGPAHDCRKIIRLDADPKVANTIEGRGSGPETMASVVA